MPYATSSLIKARERESMEMESQKSIYLLQDRQDKGEGGWILLKPLQIYA